LEELRDSGGRVIIVGSADVGKTTLACWLAEQLARSATTAWVDADVGQSQIGPPATVGWRLMNATVGHCYFVGDVSPADRSATVLSGLVRAVSDAEACGARHVVVDTTGYVAGHDAVALKTAKVDLLAPVHVVALGNDRPIRRLLRCWKNYPAVCITQLDTSAAVSKKSVCARRQHRSRLFAQALAGAQTRWVNVTDKALVRGNARAAAQLPDGLLLGFVDEKRHLVCLGLLQALDVKNRRLLVYAPEPAESAVGIVFGAMVLSTSGEQLGMDAS
jgi:polynucleotide 5'-kinase involved in rRNA processing